MIPEIDPDAPRAQLDPAPRWAGPLSGLIAAAVAVCVGMLVAAVIDVDSPLNAVGSEFIDHTPAWLKSLAINLFGTADKTALRVGMVSTIGLLSLAVGSIARHRRIVGPVAMAVFGLVGAVIAAGRPNQTISAAVPAIVSAFVGGGLVWSLIGLVRAGDGSLDTPGRSKAPAGWDRRRFMIATSGAVGGAVVVAGSSRRLENARIDDIRQAAPAELPTALPAVAAPEIPADATLSPVTPFVTPNDDFYLIDTALSVPRIRLDRWAVEIGGRVDRPLRLTYDDLLARPQVERVITIACVSNEVGGDLIGNAVWQGVLLKDILDEAGVQPDAQQVFGTSVDGWTCGFPVEAAFDGRDAMIAIGMNGELLPVKHGFPARVIIPGLYGYVSATKWLSRLDLTTWDEAEGYWIPRGWSRDAPIKTQSRIDVPGRTADLRAGPVVVAGIAWAQQRGIAEVEVRIDDGEWQEATLGAEVTIDAWRQWRYDWAATPGGHRLQVRATDNDGETQTDEVARPDPDGATGWHTRTVNVA